MNSSYTLTKNTLQYAHPGWHPILLKGLDAMAKADPQYLSQLEQDNYLPTVGRLFAAFSLPLDRVRYVLIGEGPYPRADSASGYAFMDGAVKEIWTKTGLSGPVNRATSLRNFFKMLLVADNLLSDDNTRGEALAPIAQMALANPDTWIQTLADLQNGLLQHGFLLLNATLVYRSGVPAVKETKAWQPFMQTILRALLEHANQQKSTPPTLVLWGKMAEKLLEWPSIQAHPIKMAEHPYNLSFIQNKEMQALFGALHLLRK